MKSHLLKLTTVFTSLFFLFASPTFALTLDSIGSSTVTTQTFSEWWYTAENPTLSGTAAASSTVTITIDSVSYTTTTDASGNWSFTPTTLTTGDRSVTITGDGQTLSFTLHVGQNVPSTNGSATSSGTLPVSGSTTQTLALLTTGAAIIFLGLKLKPAPQLN